MTQRKPAYTACHLCELTYTTEVELEEHIFSLLHHRSLATKFGSDYNHICNICSENYKGLSAYVAHLQSESHINQRTERTKLLGLDKQYVPRNLHKFASTFLCKPLRKREKPKARKRNTDSPIRPLTKQLSKTTDRAWRNPSNEYFDPTWHPQPFPDSSFSRRVFETFHPRQGRPPFPPKRRCPDPEQFYHEEYYMHPNPRFYMHEGDMYPPPNNHKVTPPFFRQPPSYMKNQFKWSKPVSDVNKTKSTENVPASTETNPKPKTIKAPEKQRENVTKKTDVCLDKNVFSPTEQPLNQGDKTLKKCETSSMKLDDSLRPNIVVEVNRSVEKCKSNTGPINTANPLPFQLKKKPQLKCKLKQVKVTILKKRFLSGSTKIPKLSKKFTPPSNPPTSSNVHMESVANVASSTSKKVIKPNVKVARSRLISNADKSSSDEGEKLRRNITFAKLFNNRKHSSKNVILCSARDTICSANTRKLTGPRFGIGLAQPATNPVNSVIMSELKDVDVSTDDELSAALSLHFSDEDSFSCQQASACSETTTLKDNNTIEKMLKSGSQPIAHIIPVQSSVMGKNHDTGKTETLKPKTTTPISVIQQKTVTEVSQTFLNKVKSEPIENNLSISGNVPSKPNESSKFLNTVIKTCTVNLTPIKVEEEETLDSHDYDTKQKKISHSNPVNKSLNPVVQCQGTPASLNDKSTCGLSGNNPESSNFENDSCLINMEEENLEDLFERMAKDSERNSGINQSEAEATQIDGSVNLNGSLTQLNQVTTPNQAASCSQTMLLFSQISNAQNDLDLIKSESMHITALITQYNIRQSFLKQRETLLKTNIQNMQMSLKNLQNQRPESTSNQVNTSTLQNPIESSNLPDIVSNTDTVGMSSKQTCLAEVSVRVKSEPVTNTDVGFFRSQPVDPHAAANVQADNLCNKSSLSLRRRTLSNTTSAAAFKNPVRKTVSQTTLNNSLLRDSSKTSSTEMSLAELHYSSNALNSHHSSAIVSLFVTNNNEIISCSKDKTVIVADALSEKVFGKHKLDKIPTKSFIALESQCATTNCYVYCMLLVYTELDNLSPVRLKSNVQQVKITICNHNVNFATTNFVHYDNAILCVHYSKPTAYIGTRDGRVLMYNCTNLKVDEVFDCHSPHSVTALTSGTDGARRVLCCGTSNSQVSIRDADDGLLLRLFTGHTKTINCLNLVHDLLYSGSTDRTILVHSISSGTLMHRISGFHNGSVRSLCVYKNSVASICTDKNFRVFTDTPYFLAGSPKQFENNPVEMYLHPVTLKDNTIKSATIPLAYIGFENGTIQTILLSQLTKHPECIDFSILENENSTVDMIYSQLKSFQCKWDGCEESLIGLSGLKEHFYSVHATNAFLEKLECCCLWQDCTHYFTKDVDTIEDVQLHLTNHFKHSISNKKLTIDLTE
ncbi:uncharacterized protein LOC100178710 [Ciona intestinalis]